MDAIENFDSEYAHNQRVYITTGFYKNNYGQIIGFDKKTSRYNVEINNNATKRVIACLNIELRPVKRFLWMRY